MKIFHYLALFAIGFTIGCENHPADEPTPLADIEVSAELQPDLSADLKALEARVANLEKACIDGKPEPPKFSAQTPKKKLSPRERVKCIIYCFPKWQNPKTGKYEETCPAGGKMKEEVVELLTGELGWKAGESEDNDIIFRESESFSTCPTIEFRVDDSVKLRIFGRMPAADVSNKLNGFINSIDREA
jgi:hypothetical protein